MKVKSLSQTWGVGREKVDSGEESDKTSVSKAEEAGIIKRVEAGEKDGRRGRALGPDH